MAISEPPEPVILLHFWVAHETRPHLCLCSTRKIVEFSQDW